jgi:small nuclear ribonucleoprotein (snRNP)-like protein
MNDFWLTMAILFAAAAVAAFMARRKRDRCLKYFTDEPVIIPMESGKWIWGRFFAYPKAIELVFDNPQPDDSGRVKANYILYGTELDELTKILQIPPQSGTPEYQSWQREVESIANPSLYRRINRWVWNTVNALRDAISQSFNILIGSMKNTTPMGKVAGADKRAGEIGNTLLGTVPNSYEPVLEKYLSKQVVVEMLENDEVIELAGVLQEYSGKYLLLRDVAYQPDVDIGSPLPERFDIIFPRNRALVRHCLEL